MPGIDDAYNPEELYANRAMDGIPRGVLGGDRMAVRGAIVAAYLAGELEAQKRAAREAHQARAWDRVAEANETTRKATEQAGVVEGAKGDTKSSETPSVVEELASWWRGVAHEEIEGLLAKMTEYGGAHRAQDLTDIGRQLVAAGVQEPRHDVFNADEEEAVYQELGIYFYLVGKFGRWTAAIAEGRPVSDDTLHDIGIYVRMAQRIRVAGGWPV